MSRTLTAENLAAGFGAKSGLARRAIGALVEAVAARPPAAMGQWRTLFSRVSAWDLHRPPPKKLARLTECYSFASESRPGTQPEVVLFALHTYYAAAVQALVQRFDELRAVDLLSDGPLGWHRDRDFADLRRAMDELRASMSEYDAGGVATGDDLLKRLYESLFPQPVRHALGEYYTPDWLAEHVLDQVGYAGQPGVRLLDPACGSGTFLMAALRRRRAAGARPQAADNSPLPQAGEGQGVRAECRQIPVVGFDLNPLAVLSARANWLVAVRDLLPASAKIEIPIYLCDSILDGPALEPFDVVVGNPPWIAWDNLPEEYRQATKPLWQRYGLFSLSARDARHGGSKKDLSMLMLYVAADRYLRPGGRLGMVLARSLFQSKGAGDGFRRFSLGPEGPPLGVVRVDDFAALRPFGAAAAQAATVALEKGAATSYPVPYFSWSPQQDRQSAEQRLAARPVDPAQPGSPWLVCPEGDGAQTIVGRGPSDYTAHLGANTGGANGVYWLEIIGRTADGLRVRNIVTRRATDVPVVEAVIEPELVYPLVRWGDVARGRARPSAYLLLAQDPETRTGIDEQLMRRKYPLTYAYLKRFEPLLRRRAAYRRYQDAKPFYSMYNVGPYTLARLKVVWRRMDRQIRAAVVGPCGDPWLGRRPVVPQETCVLVACDCPHEAQYLCAVLNSDEVQRLVAGHSVRGGKGFGTPGMLDYLGIERFRPDDVRHRQLSNSRASASS